MEACTGGNHHLRLLPQQEIAPGGTLVMNWMADDTLKDIYIYIYANGVYCRIVHLVTRVAVMGVAKLSEVHGGC